MIKCQDDPGSCVKFVIVEFPTDYFSIKTIETFSKSAVAKKKAPRTTSSSVYQIKRLVVEVGLLLLYFMSCNN